MLVFAEADTTTTLLIALVGSGGLLGALLGLIKLRGETDSRAVSQAQGAMETMSDLNAALRESERRANERADFYKARYEEAVAQIERLSARWGPFPVDDET